MFVSETGHAYPCCIIPESSPPLVDDTDKPIQVNETSSINQIINTSKMKEMRRQMLLGEKPKICSRCYELEDDGLQSHRQGSNHILRNEVENSINTTKQDGEIFVDVVSMDFRLGNNCNLRCRMCSPFSSKLLIPEQSNYEPEKAPIRKQA